MPKQEAVSPATVPPPVAILRIIRGFWLSRAVYVAAKLGLPDLVANGPTTAEELAAATSAHAPSLYRILRALASEGIFVEDEAGRFALTPVASALQTDVPHSLRAMATTELGEEHYPAWGDALYSVKTGGIAFNHRFKMNVWEFFAKNPENARIFNDAMTDLTAVVNKALLKAYDFSSFGRIVDVGGGHGGLMISLLQANPGLKGVVFDSPQVAEGAKRQIELQGLTSRCDAVGGDFFQFVPGGGDAYLLKWILHDWNDEQSATILTKCRRVMAQAGRLLLVEAVMPKRNDPGFPKFMDLNMLVMTGGRERTEHEWRKLFEAAGFRLNRIVPTESDFCIIEGLPV